MKKDTVFRGCTRPPMFMGVPYTPFFIAAGIILILTAYINIFWIAATPVVTFILRQIAKQDEMIFRLWGLKMKFLMKARNKNSIPGTIIFSPNIYREKPSKK